MHIRRSVASAASVVAASVLLALIGAAAPAGAQSSTTTVVRRSNIAASRTAAKTNAATPWFRNTLTGGGSIAFMTGPATPPLGSGSLRLGTTGTTSKAQLFDYAYVAKKLTDLSSLSYRTYRDPSSTASMAQLPALNLDVDYAGTGFSFTSLVFEPIYNPAQGAIVAGAWQTWDAFANGTAKWWSTQAIPGVCATSCYVTWATIVANNPNAKVSNGLTTGGMGFNVGSGWANVFTGSVDALAIGFSSVETVFDFEPGCGLDCYVATTGNDANDGTSYADAKKTIQAAIDTVQPGGTVHVNNGTYPESPNITKSLTLVSENGAALTTIDLQTGPTYLGSLTIAGQEVTVNGFTIEGFDGSSSTQAATNVTVLPSLGHIVVSNNILKVGRIGSASLGDDGIGVETYYDTANDTDSLTLTSNQFQPLGPIGTRAFYVNPGTDDFLAQGNVITGNFEFTSVTQAKHGVVRGNTVTGSGTSASLGTWGYPNANVYGRTEFDANTISGTATGFRIRGSNNVTIHHNVVSNVTDGVTVFDNAGDGLTAQLDGATVVIRDNSFTGITGKRVTNGYPSAVNASANWWGTKAVAASNVTGPVDLTPVLTVGTDTSASAGFQGSVAEVKAHTLGAQIGTEGRIQEGIDSTVAGGIVDVAPGLYSETATGRTTTVPGPTYQFGLYVGADRDGVTVRGVDAADAPITSSAGTLARITTNAANNFGYSGTFVVGSDATFQGLEFGTNSPSSNKTFEVIGDGFSLRDSYVNDTFGSVYLNDWLYDTGTQTSSIATFTIDGNRFAPDNQITIASGTGYGHPESGRLITDNVFDSAPTGLFISFRGAAGPGGVPWYTYPVGGAVITGNTFGPADINIRATDAYAEDQLDWQAFRDLNTFTRLVWVEQGSTGDLRSFAYSSSGYAFVNSRQLGGRIDWRTTASRPAGVQIAQAGDTVHVYTGIYPEQAIVDKAGITVDGYGPTKPLVDDGGAATGNGLLITGDGVTLSDVRVQGYDVGVRLGGGSDSLLDGVSVLRVESTGNAADGLFASAIAGLSNVTIDDGIYSDNANASIVPTPGGRGIAVWDGPKSNISITDVTANGNALVGIDINDGNVTGLTITGNTVVGNADSGIGVLGAKGPGANLVANNTVTNNGRFGIEIKIPTGSGAASGAGSVVVSGNTVNLTAPANRAQDLAGIAVFRRSVSALNADQPTGTYVIGNTISGYQNTGTGDGFGIVVEGTGHTVTQNIVDTNEVGVQAQAGNPAANQTDTDWFDRGNAASYGGTVSGNSITGNTTSFRAVGIAGAADASGNWWGTIDQSVVAAHIVGDVDFTPYFHTGSDTASGTTGFQGDYSQLDVVRIGAQVGSQPRIQEAIDMVTGSTVYVHAGTYVADVDADVPDLHLLGAQQGAAVASRSFGDAAEATIDGQLTIRAAGVTVDGFSLTHTTATTSAIGILVKTAGDDASISNTIIHGVSTPNVSGTAQAIYLEHGPDGVTIADNAISDVSSTRSAKGIYIGDSTATDDSHGVVISDNVITDITSSARGGYGIQTNNAAGAVLDIAGNTISDLSGSWVHGIGIEGDAPALYIHHNHIGGLTAAGIDKVAVFFESDASWDEAEVHNNDLAVGASAFGVALHPTLVVPGSVDATCNWWGDASGPGTIAAGTGALVGSSVGYSPWLTSTDLDGDCDSIVETVAPTTPLSFAEGTHATNGGAFDNGTATIAPNVGSIGTVTDHHDGTWSWSLAADDAANDGPASGTVTLTATTSLGATATTSFDYTITNVAPSGTFLAPAEVAVGDDFGIEFDPTTDPATADTFAYTFTCDGASPVTGSGASTTCAAPTSGQVGTFIHVTGSITDDDGATSVLYEDDVLVVPALTLSPSSHDFGAVQVGDSSAPMTFTLTNHSDVAYDVDEVGFFVIATNHFKVVDTGSDECSGETLGAHASCDFEVVFTPLTSGPKTTTLGVELDGVQAPLPKPASALSGLGIAPVATVTPDSIDFGSRAIGAGPSGVQTITVENTGDTGSSLAITSITRTGSSAFAETHGTLVPLGVGETLDIDVVFDPSTVGDHHGSIVIKTSAGTFSVALTGIGESGPVLKVTPSSHDFGDVTVDHSKTKLFTVANTGTEGLTGLVVTVSGDDLSIVADDSTCDETDTLADGESCTVTVRYQPHDVGDDAGTLDAIADGGPADTSTLAGSGVPGKPLVTVNPDEYQFDPIVVGDAPEVQDFTVRNTGDATLSGIDIEITGAPAFTVVTGDGADCETEATSLAPDATCMVWVQFAPGAAGDKSATLKVLSANAGNGTVNVPLSGTALAPALTVSPSSYDFGGVAVDHSRSRTFTVTNSGTSPLTGLVVGIDGDEFSIVAYDSDCDETTGLDAGESCDVRVRYSPEALGDDTGTLTATADGGLSDTSDLEGTGKPAKGVVTVDPDEWQFGSVEIETTSSKVFTIENTGEATLTDLSFLINGPFSIVETTCGDTLGEGESCTVTVEFCPVTPGFKSGTLKVLSSHSANPTVNVPLAGKATPHPADVSVTPNPHDFGNVVFLGTRTRIFTVTNSGGSPVTIGAITRTGSSTFTVLAADDECDGETLGEDESCAFKVRFQAPSSTAGVKNAIIHVTGTGFDEIVVPVTATAEAFKAKIDAFVTNRTDKAWHYAGRWLYCAGACPRQQAAQVGHRGKTITYRVRVRNDGNGVDDIRVRLYQTGSKASIERIQVLRNGNQDVTARVSNGSYVARDVNPGAEIYFWVRVTVRTAAVPGLVNYVIISGQSTRTPRVKDYVRMRTTVR